MNDDIEYEKFTQEIYNEILKNLYVNNIDVKHNMKLTGKSGQKHQIDVYWEYQYDNTTLKFGEHYGIDLMELREPEEGEAIVAETTLTIGSSVRHRLFQVDEDWAKEHDFNIQLYKERLDWLFSPNCSKWIHATHIPLTTKENKITNAKYEIIADIQKLEEEIPENCQQNKDYVFPFDDAYI